MKNTSDTFDNTKEITNPDDNDAESVSITQTFFELLHAVIVAIIVVVFLLNFVFRLVDVDGESMMDTLHDNDKVFVTNALYTPADGDIVVISHGQEYEKPIIKRVIATEGQTLKIDFEKGQVIVDGVILDEPYIKETTETKGNTEIPTVIPEGKVFVMGDNRNHSLDSRYHEVGLIDEKDIIGKAQFILFPFNRFGSIL